jgi:site-specific recombinase XerD
MLDHFLRDRAATQRLRANPIGSHLDGFSAWLSQRGFAWTTIRQDVWALAAFGRWLHRRGRSIRNLHRHDADDFCRRRCAVHRRERDIAALRSFLAYLEAAHLIPATPQVIDRSPLAQLKDRYEAYLQRDRALSPLTITRHWFVLRRFLVERFGDGRIDLRALRSEDVTRYLLRHVPAQSRFSTDVSMLRSFLRFLWQVGDTDRDLAAAIPPIRRWRLVEVPKYLAPEVAHCSRRSIGRRRVVGATTPSCFCWRVWVCAPARSSGWSWKISTGARES